MTTTKPGREASHKSSRFRPKMAHKKILGTARRAHSTWPKKSTKCSSAIAPTLSTKTIHLLRGGRKCKKSSRCQSRNPWRRLSKWISIRTLNRLVKVLSSKIWAKIKIWNPNNTQSKSKLRFPKSRRRRKKGPKPGSERAARRINRKSWKVIRKSLRYTSRFRIINSTRPQRTH